MMEKNVKRDSRKKADIECFHGMSCESAKREMTRECKAGYPEPLLMDFKKKMMETVKQSSMNVQVCNDPAER